MGSSRQLALYELRRKCLPWLEYSSTQCLWGEHLGFGGPTRGPCLELQIRHLEMPFPEPPLPSHKATPICSLAVAAEQGMGVKGQGLQMCGGGLVCPGGPGSLVNWGQNKLSK